MLDGPWGSGKTFFIKKFLKSAPKHLYVSLYGISEVRQIDEEFYRQLHPVLSSRGMRVLGQIGKAVLKGTLKFDIDGDGKDDGTINPGLPEIDLTAGLSDPRERLLVFDDLERCSMKVSQILGYINAFVEHDGLKVIILANEAEILSRDEERYAEIKEKLVGQTLRIRSTVEMAYSTFLAGISDTRIRSFLDLNREKAIGIHKQSETNNLRLLKQALWDYERLAAHLQPEHWAKDAAMVALMSVILALSIEHRAGRIIEVKQIEVLINGGLLRAIRRQKTDEKTIEDQIQARYPQVNFEDSVLGPQIIANVVINGMADAEAVKDALATARHFANPCAIPLWRRAWDLYDATDEEAAVVAVEFRKAFEAREFREQGIVYHAFGIALRYARIQLWPVTPDEILAKCKSYVNDLDSAGHINECDKELGYSAFGRSYQHYGFMEMETSQFQEAIHYYENAAEVAARREYPSKARALLESLADGSDDFLLDLATNNVRASPYYDKPILATIPAEEFVRHILQLRPQLQRKAADTLKSRYQFPNALERLADEAVWLQNVRDLLKEKCDVALPLSKERLSYMIESNLDPALADWREAGILGE